MATKKYIAILCLTLLAVMAQIVFVQKAEAKTASVAAWLSHSIGMTAQELQSLAALPKDRIMAALVADSYCLNGAVAEYKEGPRV